MYQTIDPSQLGIVDRLLGVNLKISIWSGRKKLTAQDLGVDDLPPDELASLGSKKVCDPALLKIFQTLKGRANGVLERYGLPFLGGRAIPEHKAMDVHEQLKAIEQEFNDAKEEFLRDYEPNVQKWLTRQKEWSSIIEGELESKDYVRNRISFQSFFCALSLPSVTGEGSDSLCQSFIDEVAGLGSTLYDDVAAAATEVWRNSFRGQNRVSHRALLPIRKICEKLNNFSFVDPTVMPVTEIIQATLESIPQKGYLEGMPLVQLQGLVSLLRDKEALADLAERKMSGLSTEDILTGFISVEKAEIESETDVQDVPVSIIGPVHQAAVPINGQTSLFDLDSTMKSLAQAVPFMPVPQQQASPMAAVDLEPELSASAAEDNQIIEDEVVFEEAPLASVPVTPDSQIEFPVSQTEMPVVIPVAPGGIGDFLNGFI